MPGRLKILFLTPRFPFPLIGGDRLKPYKLLSHLGKYYDTTLITLSHGGYPTQEYLNEIARFGVKVIPIPLDPIKAGLRAGPLTLFTDMPLEIAFYNQPEFHIAVEKVLKKEKFDLAFAFFMRTAEYLKDKQIKKVLIAEDCRTLYQSRSYKETANIKQKLIRWWEAKKLAKYEPKILNYFDAVSLVTTNDIEAMRGLNSNVDYRLLTNGTDTDRFIPSESNERNGILFASKMDIWANVLMIKRIVEDIFPGILKEVPEAKLRFVGANPSKYINSLANESIEIIADVPDMLPYLQQAALFLHPHSGGTGIQNKLLEAMSAGCPVVTTPTGIQGIPAIHGESVMLGANNEELIRHTVYLLRNKEFAGELGLNSRKVVVDNLSWNSVFSDFDKLIQDIISNEPTNK